MTDARQPGARATFVLVSSAVAVAAAAWLVPASVHIVGWDGAAASRVALVPSWGRLVGFVVAALVCSGAAGIYASRRGRLADLAAVLAPLMMLGLWVVPFLPWLADVAPMLLVLAGPLRWFIAAAAGTGCLVVAIALTTRGRVTVPVLGVRAVFALSLILFVLLGVHTKRVQGLGGDEPHYLVIAHSVLTDGDLQIGNNHDERDYEAFWDGVLAPHYMARGLNGEIYSVHAPGLPALLVPFYAAGGQWGAMLAVSLLASLAATSIFVLARRLTSGSAAVVTWVAVTLTVPFALQSWQIYPEIPAALVMAWVALWLWNPLPDRVGPWVWRGAALAVLPWLHTKYALLLAGATVCLLVRLWPRMKLALGLVAPLAVSGIAWLTSFYVIYGTFNPTAPYGPGAMGDFKVSYLARGLLGLAIDQQYGLLTYSPIYLLVGLGAWQMLRRPEGRWPAVGVLATSAAFVVSVAQYYMWWGGFSVPARFVVPVLPLLAPMIAMAVYEYRGVAGRGLIGLLLIVSLAALAVVTFDPEAMLMFNGREDGRGRLVEFLQGGADLTAALPNFLPLDWSAQLPQVTTWLVSCVAAISAMVAAGRAAWRGAPPAKAFWSGAVGLVVFGVTGTVIVTAANGVGSLEWRSRSGAQDLVQAYAGHRLQALSPSELRVLGEPELFERATIRWDVDVDRAADGGRIAGPFALPPGRYGVRVTFDGSVVEASEVWAAFYRGPYPMVSVATDGATPVTLHLTLPVGLDPLWIGSPSAALARTATSVTIAPLYLDPEPDPLAGTDFTAVYGIDGPAGQFLIYRDQNGYPERGSWWVPGGGSTATFVAPGQAERVTVSVRQGAEEGEVVLRTQHGEESVTLERGERHTLTIEVDPDEPLVPLTVECAAGFRPSERNPDSPDSRWLGCYVRVELS